MAPGKIGTLLKMLQFQCYSKGTELLQTKTIASNYYRADSRQGNSKVCQCIRKLLTPSSLREGNCAKEDPFSSFMLLILTNTNYSKYQRCDFFFLQGQIYL